MPITRSLLEEQGINRFNRREDYLFPLNFEFPLSAMNQSLPNNSVAFEKTTLEFLEVGQAIASRNFVSSATGWQILGSGDAEFNNVVIRGTIYASAGKIANWYINTDTLSSGAVEDDSNVIIDSANSLIRLGPTSGDNILIDGANQTIRSSNYNIGVSGFNISPTLIEAENILARGMMKGATFQYDVISAIGGQLLIANADVLASDMTALDAATLITKDTTDFANNDILVLRAVTGAGIEEEYLRVTDASGAPTYVVTRDLAGLFAADSNPEWKAGTTVVKMGTSDGAASYGGGWLRLLGEGLHSPHYSVYQRTGVNYNSFTETVRLGNLNGIAGLATDIFGLYMGDYASDEYFLYNSSTGNITIRGGRLNDLFDGSVTVSYDKFGRLSSFTDTDDGVTWTLTYARGRLASYTNGSDVWTFAYEGNRIVSITKT